MKFTVFIEKDGALTVPLPRILPPHATRFDNHDRAVEPIQIAEIFAEPVGSPGQSWSGNPVEIIPEVSRPHGYCSYSSIIYLPVCCAAKSGRENLVSRHPPRLPELIVNRMSLWPQASHLFQGIGPWLSQRGEMDYLHVGVGIDEITVKSWSIDVFPFGVEAEYAGRQRAHLGAEFAVYDLHVIKTLVGC